MNSNSELSEINEKRIEAQDVLIKAQFWQTCINCINWNGNISNAVGAAGCGLFKAMPPPHIIVSGCRDHEGDIPF